MPEIFLLRHGQASFDADDYDQLSSVGVKQAQWVGQHLASLDRCPDVVIRGAMRRHEQTTLSVLESCSVGRSPEVMAGLNEYNLRGLIKHFQQCFPKAWVDTGDRHRDYARNMKRALDYWISGELSSDGEESWLSFSARVLDALQQIGTHKFERALVVTSGGAIGAAVASVLDASEAATRDLIMQSRNTSISTFRLSGSRFILDSFNDTSHLATPERIPYMTFF